VTKSSADWEAFKESSGAAKDDLEQVLLYSYNMNTHARMVYALFFCEVVSLAFYPSDPHTHSRFFIFSLLSTPCGRLRETAFWRKKSS
jgi:hypothetical protein